MTAPSATADRQAVAQKPVRKRRPARVTDRTFTMLRLVADGMSNEEIASELGVSTSTVQVSLTALAKAWGVSGRAAWSRSATCGACWCASRSSRWSR